MDKYKLSKIFISALNSELSELYVKGMRNAINMNASPDGEQEESYRRAEAFNKEFEEFFAYEISWFFWKDVWRELYGKDERFMKELFDKVIQKLMLVYRNARFRGKTKREARNEVSEVGNKYFYPPDIA
jgi:hypothetical protein